MSKQVKLSEAEIRACQMARDAIADIGDWANTAEGVDYWLKVSTRLRSMAYHGTSDGKPWVEPEPEIVIDDQWAAVWPRRLVMVRDDECKGWEGPYHLGCVCTGDTEHPFSTVEGEIYSLCRPCTPDEIAAYESANGRQEQLAEPEPEPIAVSKLHHAATVAIKELREATSRAFVVGSTGMADGDDKRHEVVARFRSIEEMQAFHRALMRCCMLASEGTRK